MGTGGRVGLGAWGREDGGTEVGKIRLFMTERGTKMKVFAPFFNGLLKKNACLFCSGCFASLIA